MVSCMKAYGKGFWLLQAAGWTAFVGALLLPWLGSYPAGPMLARKIPIACVGLLTTLGLRWLYRAVRRRGYPPWVVGAAAIAGSGAGAWVWAAVVQRLEPETLIRASLDRFPGTAYYAFVLAAWSALYFGLMHVRALAVERERSLHAEAAASRARLQALRYQLDPHFLFNTLNAISTLVVERRTDEAERTIARLGEFLRLTLEGTQADEIPLGEELEFVRRYLEIETVRFSDRLAVEIDVEPAALGARVPAMILQPIVENALQHADGRITVTARRQDRMLQVSVTDNGRGLVDAPRVGHGIGLANTRERLRHLYGNAQRLELQRTEGGGVRATMELPFATP